jgi:hypothetical protein
VSQLLKRFSYPASATIWSIMATPTHDALVLETRDEQQFQTRFTLLDLNTGIPRWERRSLEEAWWVSLVDVSHDVILVHQYLTKGNPDRKALMALHTDDFSLRWRIDDFSFHARQDQVIYGFSTREGWEPAMLQVDSGIVEKTAWENNIAEAKRFVQNPVLYAEGNPHFESFRSFLSQTRQQTITGAVEYLERSEITAISYYVAQPDGLANYLLVLDQEGNTLLQTVLATALKGLGTDTFFSLADCLIFVKNKSELESYQIV